MIRLLLVDDQALIRGGIRGIMELAGDIVIVGECSDGDEVLDAIENTQPDVILMDVRMKRVDGTTATRLVREVGGPPVLILTTFDDDETIAAALQAGASGFLLKDAAGEEMIQAIEHVAAGDAWLDPRITGRVLGTLRERLPDPANDVDLSPLTERELDVLRVIGRGATNAEAADELSVSEATIKSHLGRVLTKLDLRDRAAVIVVAHQQQLV